MIRTSRGGIWGWIERRAVVRWLGMELPKAARDVRFLRWQPSNDLAYHELLVRFETSIGVYREWTSTLGLENIARSALPEGAAVWRAPPEIAAPPWWDPSPEMAPDTAWRRVGAYGSVVVKWERENVYVHLVDTGHAAGRGT